MPRRSDRCYCSSCQWARVRNKLLIVQRGVNASCPWLVAGYILWRIFR